MKAVEYMNQAIAKDPNYALAYAGLADCYVVQGDRRVITGEEAYTKGMAAAQRGLELDPSLPEPHAAVADLRKEHDFNWAGAEAEFKRALEVNPNYATAHQWYGLLLEDVGRLEEARRQIETARGLDPLSLVIQVNVGDLYEALHEFDRAIDEYRKVEEITVPGKLTFIIRGAEGISRDTRDQRRKGLRIASSTPPALSLSKVLNSRKWRRSGFGLAAAENPLPRRIRHHNQYKGDPLGGLPQMTSIFGAVEELQYMARNSRGNNVLLHATQSPMFEKIRKGSPASRTRQ